MSQVATHPRGVGADGFRRKHWTKAEFLRLARSGVLEGASVYLFRGELLDMAPIGFEHAGGMTRASYILSQVFRQPDWFVRPQCEFEVPGDSFPQPDVAVCSAADAWRDPCPDRAALIVEIAYTSLRHDRDKAFDYAAAQVPEYWILDVERRVLEVYRDVVADASAPLGFRYSESVTLSPDDSIAPLGSPQSSVSVREMLP